jgi:hypothetical protein
MVFNPATEPNSFIGNENNISLTRRPNSSKFANTASNKSLNASEIKAVVIEMEQDKRREQMMLELRVNLQNSDRQKIPAELFQLNNEIFEMEKELDDLCRRRQLLVDGKAFEALFPQKITNSKIRDFIASSPGSPKEHDYIVPIVNVVHALPEQKRKLVVESAASPPSKICALLPPKDSGKPIRNTKNRFQEEEEEYRQCIIDILKKMSFHELVRVWRIFSSKLNLLNTIYPCSQRIDKFLIEAVDSMPCDLLESAKFYVSQIC